jgi:uncharacterized integral membrane protein
MTAEDPHEDAPPPSEAPPAPPAGKRAAEPSLHTRISGYWAAVVAGLVIALVLIVFILENSARVKVSFFGAHAHLPEGVALLLSAVIGGLLTVVVGAARILQLRARARHKGRRAKTH